MVSVVETIYAGNFFKPRNWQPSAFHKTVVRV